MLLFLSFLYFLLWFFFIGILCFGICFFLLLLFLGFCVLDLDECMLDVDCDGFIKKCCYNNCFKVCVELGISVI